MAIFNLEYIYESLNNKIIYSLATVKSIASKIASKTKSDEKDPVGNQNCLLCTLCMEANLRGMNILPRPVYSPRDIIFKHGAAPIVINPSRVKINNKDHVISIVDKAKNGARYYAHVNWKGSKGGHEFLVCNIDDEVYVVDAQAGLVAPVASNTGSKYFDDINWDNSFMYRTDTKELNKNILKYNDMKYCLPWDEEKDVKYLEDHK